MRPPDPPASLPSLTGPTTVGRVRYPSCDSMKTSSIPGFLLTRPGRDWPKVAVAALMIAVLLGPRATVAERWVEPDVGGDVDAYLAASEAAVPGIKSGEAKSVLWADPEARERTPLSIVYLHGFSADRHEIDPVPRLVGEALGANVYYARLAGHGRDAAAMGDVGAEDWLDDAAEAMAVGRAIGERVILIGTSTGATLATWTAAQEQARGDIATLVLLSPNFGPNSAAAQLLLWPWGNLIARVTLGSERCFEAVSEAQALHWTTCYPSSALLPMMAVVERTRTLDLDEITVPTLMMYSPEDLVVDPDASVAMFGRMGGLPKRLLPTAAAERGGYHVLAGDIISPESTTNVTGVVLDFVTAAIGDAR